MEQCPGGTTPWEEEAAREEVGSKKQKKGDSEKTSLYASQKPMSQKAKYRKGTRNPQAWR